jgi:hypothetical protein
MKNLYIIVLFLSLSGAYAQDEIETSPDQYETPSPAPKGIFQMENRFTVQDNRNNSHSLILPSTNWKYGITNDIEAIIVSDLVFDTTQDSTASGLQPLKFGLKVKLWDEKGLLPNAAISLQVSLPKLASKDWQATYLAPNLRLLLKNKITETVSIGFNFGGIWDGDTPDAQFFYSVSPKFKISQKFECFIESYGYLRQTSTAENWLDGGLMYLITNNIQVELSAGYELSNTEGGHSYFGLAGLAFRI